MQNKHSHKHGSVNSLTTCLTMSSRNWVFAGHPSSSCEQRTNSEIHNADASQFMDTVGASAPFVPSKTEGTVACIGSLVSGSSTLFRVVG